MSGPPVPRWASRCRLSTGCASKKWYDYVKEYFTAPWASEFFNTDELMHLLDLHFAGKGDFQRKIYTPLVFLVWYKRFFIDEGQPTVQAA